MHMNDNERASRFVERANRLIKMTVLVNHGVTLFHRAQDAPFATKDLQVRACTRFANVIDTTVVQIHRRHARDPSQNLARLRRMTFDTKFLIIMALVTYSVLGRTTDSKYDLFKETYSKKQSGSMLMEIAKELVQRSSSTSQVLNLNLSNLLLLLLLKAVVFGAGYLGHNGHKGRELEEESVVSEGEIALALGYLMGDTCLYRAACEDPDVAKEYLGAAEMLIETVKLLPQVPSIEGKYEKTMMEFRKAIEHGITDGCPPEYTCKKDNIRNFLKEE
ncbi:uncharacterized protein LOC144468638 [Augochlora pura]